MFVAPFCCFFGAFGFHPMSRQLLLEVLKSKAKFPFLRVSMSIIGFLEALTDFWPFFLDLCLVCLFFSIEINNFKNGEVGQKESRRPQVFGPSFHQMFF